MTLKFNPILACDSYKFFHQFSYPDDVTGMFSYIEARTKGQDIMIPFGLQIWLNEFLTVPITVQDIDEAESFAAAHGEPFSRAAWELVITRYQGFLPLKIRTVPEGTPVRSGNAIVTIECIDPDLFWLCSYIETALLRAVWYPTTIASMDYDVKRTILGYYQRTGADLSMLPFALHDFGARGVTSSEQARIGGAAHLVNFMGSDTIEGVRTANYYYKEAMAGFSVPATEHSVECAFGLEPEQEIEYVRHVLKNVGKRGSIVSIVIDGKDVYRCARMICTTLKDEIIQSGVKVVFRPDSGDMMEVIPFILRLQAETFGAVKNEAGFLKIQHVGLLQGDGVDHMAIESLLGKMMAMGYAADNIVFGSGGALLQKVNRDSYKFAMKCSAVKKNGTWVGVAKDPVTDHGKKSKEGVITLVRSKMTNQMHTARLDNLPNGLDDEFEDMMVTVYDGVNSPGKILNETTLSEVRARCA